MNEDPQTKPTDSGCESARKLSSLNNVSVSGSYYGRPIEQGRPLYFHPVSSSFFFFFSSPNLSGRRLDAYHTSTHGACLSANLECRSEMCCTRLDEKKYRTQKSRQNSPSRHHRTTLSGYIFITTARIDNRKKIVKNQYLLHMS